MNLQVRIHVLRIWFAAEFEYRGIISEAHIGDGVRLDDETSS